MLGIFGLHRGDDEKKSAGPTVVPTPAIGGEDEGGFNLWSSAVNFFKDPEKELRDFGGAVGGFFGINKKDPAAAEEAGAGAAGAAPAAEPAPPPPAAAGGTPAVAAAASAASAAAALAKGEPPPPATPIPAAAAAAAALAAGEPPAPPRPETPPPAPPRPAEAGAGAAPAAEPAPPLAAAPRPAPRPAEAGAAYAGLPQEYSSKDIVAELQSLPPRPEFGIGPVFERSIENSTIKVESGVKKIERGFEENDKKNPVHRVGDTLGGILDVSGALLGGLARTTAGIIPGAIGELENLANSNEKREGGGDKVPASDTKHHLVSSNLERAVTKGAELLKAPLEFASGLLDSENTDKSKVFTKGLTGAIANAGDVLESIAGAAVGLFGVDIDEEKRRVEKEKEAKDKDEEDAQEKAKRKAEEEAKRKAEEERKRKDAAEAATKADDQKKTYRDIDFADKSPEFKSLFYIADDPDRYSKGFDESTRGNSILMRSKFELNNEGVNSVTFFENVDVESRKSGTFFGTKKRTTENGKKEVVFVGDEAFNAQNKMYEEYFENAKKILELKAKVEKYNQGKSDDEKIELGDLCDIKEQKDFNFLVKDQNNKNIVNRPLKQRLDKINKKISGISLQDLDEDESNKIEKKANEYAKILLAAQVKNNCLYTEKNGNYEEAKRINIFRGKKDFKTGKSVTEVKFGSSCQKDDFALIPVDQQSGLFCKVSYESNADAKIEYFIKKDNDLKLIKYNKDVSLIGSNLKFDDDSDVSNKKEIIKVIENHKIEVSWSDKIVNRTKQLDTDIHSVGGGDDKVFKTPDDDGINSFGSQSFVINQQNEYRLKSRDTADWWNNMTRKPWIKSLETEHSHKGFSIEKKSTRLSSTGNKFISTFSKHKSDPNSTKKILASEFEIDVKIDSSGTITSKNSDIDSEKNPELAKAIKILNKLKFDDNGELKDGFSPDSTEGVQSRFFRKPKFLGGEVKQGGSMVVNMNVVNENGVKSRIRVEFGVKNMRPGLITTGDKLVIKSVSKIDQDRERKWVKSIKEGSDDTKAPTR